MFYGIIVGIIVLAVALDQVVKYLVVRNIPLGGCAPVLDGIVHLTYTQNKGAAFSAFWGQRWMFLVIFLIFGLVLVWMLKKKYPLPKFEYYCLTAIFGGGLGNAIDRCIHGYVVDMIAVDFFQVPMPSFNGGLHFNWQPFAVFNVADCFITCGVVLLMVHLIFFNKEFWKDGKKA